MGDIYKHDKLQGYTWDGNTSVLQVEVSVTRTGLIQTLRARVDWVASHPTFHILAVTTNIGDGL